MHVAEKGCEKMDDSQLMKGILEGCVLAIIAREETYGYEIISVLNKYGFCGIQDGTLYPILTRLEKKNYVTCRIVKSTLGPRRKYFSITEEGKKSLESFEESLKHICGNAIHIIEDMGGENEQK